MHVQQHQVCLYCLIYPGICGWYWQDQWRIPNATWWLSCLYTRMCVWLLSQGMWVLDLVHPSILLMLNLLMAKMRALPYSQLPQYNSTLSAVSHECFSLNEFWDWQQDYLLCMFCGVFSHCCPSDLGWTCMPLSAIAPVRGAVESWNIDVWVQKYRSRPLHMQNPGH